LVVGGSSTREFFPSNEETAAALNDFCGTKMSVFNGSTSSQELADSAAIVDAAYERGAEPKIIVVGVTNNRLAHDWSDWNEVLAEQRVALPIPDTITSRLWPVEKLRWQLSDKVSQISRLAHLLGRGRFEASPPPPPPQGRHFYDLAPLSDSDKRMTTLIEATATDASLASDPTQVAERFVQVFDTYKARGASIVYLLTPTSPQANTVRRYQDTSVNIAKSKLAESGTVIDLRYEHGLAEDLFYDDQHLRPEGRAAIWTDPFNSANPSSAICSLQ
jgi:hypothetical protein